MLYTLSGTKPILKNASNCFIAENATVIGKVTIMDNVSIWFNAVIRGDDDTIKIGANSNIQDCVVLHVDEGSPLEIGENVTVGHGAILHGCTVGNNCLIGMHATILNGAHIGNNCIIGAGALITQKMQIPNNSVVLGAPGEIIRNTNKQDIEHILSAAKLYAEKGTRYKTEFNKL